MAANANGRQKYNLQEVLDVLMDSDDESYEFQPLQSQEDMIADSCRKLSSLKTVEDKFSFINEAEAVLKDLVSKYSSEKKGMERVLVGRIKIGEILQEETSLWLKMLKRRMIRKMRVRNP